jgi:hypothetical protein
MDGADDRQINTNLMALYATWVTVVVTPEKADE